MSRIGIDVYACYHHCCAFERRESTDELSGRTLGEDIAEAQLWNGDVISVDVAARRIEMAVPAEELARRRAAWVPPKPHFGRGYGWIFDRHILQADKGCDFDFLETAFGPGPDEPAIL